MTMFLRTIFTMAMKDLRLMSRDWMALFFIVGFPVVMGVFFGLIGASFADTEDVSIEVAVIDLDQSEYSRSFVEALVNTGSVELATTMSSPDEASELVRKGRLTAFIALPDGFGESAGVMWKEQTPIQLGVDPSRGAEAGMLEGLIMQAMGDLMMRRMQDTDSMRMMIDDVISGVRQDEDMSPAMRLALAGAMSQLDSFMTSLGAFQDAADAAGDDQSGMPEFELATIERIDVTATAGSDSEANGGSEQFHSPWDVSFPQAIMWGVLGCVAGFAISIVRERTQGTFLRLQTAPISPATILAGKATACFLAVIGVNCFMLALGYALGLRPVQPMLLIVAVLSIAVCFVGLTMLMSVIGKSEEAVGGGAWGVNVLMAMFGGGMIPLAFMPEFMKTLSHFSPVKWGVLALEGAVWRSFSISEMALPVGVLLAIGLVGMALGSAILARR